MEEKEECNELKYIIIFIINTLNYSKIKKNNKINNKNGIINNF